MSQIFIPLWKTILGHKWLTLCLLLEVMLGILAPHVWFLQVFSMIPPFFFLFPTLFVLLLYFFKRNIVYLVSAVLYLLVALIFFVEFQIPSFSNKEVSTSSFLIFNANTTYWYHDDPENYLQFLKEQNADIYQLQEIIPPREKGMANRELFKKYFPEYTLVTRGELMTLSKYPVIKQELFPEHDFMKITVQIGEKEVDFYNVHIRIHLLPQFIFSPQKFLFEVHERYLWRSEQFRLLQEEVGEERNVYISGDFNTSKMMGMMRPLLSKTTDSFRKSSIFFPTTWNMQSIPWWRLDYNLAGEGVRILLHREVLQGEFSDHGAQLIEATLE